MQVFKNNVQIINLIKRSREAENMNEQIGLLQSLNYLLPVGYEIKIPSFITNDFIDKALSALEEKITNSYI